MTQTNGFDAAAVRKNLEGELDVLARRRSEATGESHAAAYAAVLRTERGSAIYDAALVNAQDMSRGRGPY